MTQGHREKWIQKSCVSFEEECRANYNILLQVPFEYQKGLEKIEYGGGALLIANC